MKQIEQIQQFNKAFDIPLNVSKPLKEDIELRQNLLSEELTEFWEGVQIYEHANEEPTQDGIDKKQLRGRVEMFDALIDLKYVLYGVYAYLGIKPQETLTRLPKEMVYFNSHNFRICYDNIEMYIEALDHTIDNILILDNINNEINFLLAKMDFVDVFEDGFNEVHSSNMSKLENGKAIYREDGKVLKGKYYFKPNLKQFLV